MQHNTYLEHLGSTYPGVPINRTQGVQKVGEEKHASLFSLT